MLGWSICQDEIIDDDTIKALFIVDCIALLASCCWPLDASHIMLPKQRTLFMTYFYVVHRWIGVGSAAQRVLDDIVFVKKIIRIRYFEYLHRRFDRRFQVNWSSVVDGGGWNHSHVAFQNKVKSNADLAWNFNCFELSAVTFSQFSFSDLQHISLFSLMLRFRRRLFPLLLPLPLLRRSCTAASWTSSSQR